MLLFETEAGNDRYKLCRKKHKMRQRREKRSLSIIGAAVVTVLSEPDGIYVVEEQRVTLKAPLIGKTCFALLGKSLVKLHSMLLIVRVVKGI